MNLALLLLGVFIILVSFVLSLARLMNCLIVVENLNVLLLFSSLVSQSAEVRILFIALMVIFAIEVTLGLVALVRLWDLGSLIDILGV
uniref:NADH dehydrogenase subunit 4L n=1 Tax=Fischoederius elongatus TaxID=691745 RepID=A0A0M3LTM0_FISEL|nr:NADH dehydrogenase subunit 4L [Fischoederius elongatus]AJF22816.1 NADH dehydrogenase subunit 4L [Fischoederius elongatus]QIJ60103.1 NADH dehydrogenase subunit 4L [Fischoederius elongatus]